MRILQRLLPHRYSWYIRRGYGIHAIRNKREAKALYDFCNRRIAELEQERKYDDPRLAVYKKTMEIYQNNFRDTGRQDELLCCDCGQCSNFYASYDIWQYANDHAGFYWD